MITVAFLFGLAGGADVEDLARRYEIVWSSDPGTGRHTLRTSRHTLVVVPEFSTALVNGAPFRLSVPALVEGGRLRLPPELARLVEKGSQVGDVPQPFVPKQPEIKQPLSKPTVLPRCIIALDAGHGGMHTGGKGRGGLLEKDINLDVALECRKILESMGATVVMTREDDSHFSAVVKADLNARVEIVNRAAPDVFVSIHTNYVPVSGPRGFEVWVPNNAAGARDRDSRDLAGFIREELKEVWNSEDRGTKDNEDLRVLRGTKCPAALVELEFVSNPAAEKQLAASETRRKLAEAIAESLRRWILRRK